MARKPSFDFERRERAKDKAAKRAEKTKVKAEKKAIPDGVETTEAGSGTSELRDDE